MLWRVLTGVDALVIAVFAVVATLDPSHVLESEGLDVLNFQGLLPSVLVLAVRGGVLAAESHLLRTAGPRPVLIARAASAIGAFYTGRWLAVQTYSRWQDFLLGAVLGYALVGLAAIGVALLVHVSRRRPPTRPAAPARESAGRGAIARETVFGLIGVFTGVAGLLAGVADPRRLAVAVAAGAAATAVVMLFPRRPG
ncbi:hypothetical protein [Catenuloplanes atrovinosus]|uniref:Uncharacterized protein n=1 Tax=Catenuloplanes atrovinosus TaxID=137266 RepID=A0AAE3YK34_9ACTN|nr:hypothetical protein [Catenuloplanes atrovinosus]MDR7275224.1 hypothetical protein [Catenuloplanes atrovinosus]